MDINVTCVSGRLVRDPESHGKVTRLRLAFTTRQKQGEEWSNKSNFIDVVTFGKTAEIVGRYLSKGSPVTVAGRLEQNEWEKDGVKRSEIRLVANDVQLPPKGDAPTPTVAQDDLPF